jgi:hypothetical protein
MRYSVKDLKGYAIGATDDDIGKLDDFYLDDRFWIISIWWPKPVAGF